MAHYKIESIGTGNRAPKRLKTCERCNEKIYHSRVCIEEEHKPKRYICVPCVVNAYRKVHENNRPWWQFWKKAA